MNLKTFGIYLLLGVLAIVIANQVSEFIAKKRSEIAKAETTAGN